MTPVGPSPVAVRCPCNRRPSGTATAAVRVSVFRRFCSGTQAASHPRPSSVTIRSDGQRREAGTSQIGSVAPRPRPSAAPGLSDAAPRASRLCALAAQWQAPCRTRPRPMMPIMPWPLSCRRRPEGQSACPRASAGGPTGSGRPPRQGEGLFGPGISDHRGVVGAKRERRGHEGQPMSRDKRLSAPREAWCSRRRRRPRQSR